LLEEAVLAQFRADGIRFAGKRRAVSETERAGVRRRKLNRGRLLRGPEGKLRRNGAGTEHACFSPDVESKTTRICEHTRFHNFVM
jgi:hypothetical protein